MDDEDRKQVAEMRSLCERTSDRTNPIWHADNLAVLFRALDVALAEVELREVALRSIADALGSVSSGRVVDVAKSCLAAIAGIHEELEQFRSRAEMAEQCLIDRIENRQDGAQVVYDLERAEAEVERLRVAGKALREAGEELRDARIPVYDSSRFEDAAEAWDRALKG